MQLYGNIFINRIIISQTIRGGGDWQLDTRYGVSEVMDQTAGCWVRPGYFAGECLAMEAGDRQQSADIHDNMGEDAQLAKPTSLYRPRNVTH